MLSKKVQLGLGITGVYVSYTGYVYTRSQMEIQQRQRLYLDLMSEGLLDEQVKLVDPRFRSLKILGRFENPFPEYRPQTLFEFVGMRFAELTQHGRRGGLPSDPEIIKKNLPLAVPDFDLIAASRRGEETVQGYKDLPPLQDRLSYTWLGQSCALLQISSVSFMLDPLFADHLVNRYLGPQRYIPAPASLDTIINKTGGAPDFIMVSHDHPDHLDNDAISKIGNRSQWIVPLGLGDYLKDRGVTNVVEMDWWDRMPLESGSSKRSGKYEIVCLPSMHWAGRTLLDSNSRLWCSFMVLRDGKAIFYHGGDTGYSGELFRKLGEEFGPVKFSALPIGQYLPQWHQGPRHVAPQESVQIMKDLNCHKMVGVHWGTFVLSWENYLDPARQLTQLALKESRPNNIIVPQCGRTMVMNLAKMDFKHDDKAEEQARTVVYK
ncbi:DEKNAAC101227 [Brettanomyces naardenensis]|uniref:DEKNAAC101227 n=1 Tax=Brettanomyces naardenensis TaxID=13370 RepID=A0A448YH60_BRENA|nr:DEKNAAC101227 [Brettanomyces naardenensis]